MWITQASYSSGNNVGALLLDPIELARLNAMLCESDFDIFDQIVRSNANLLKFCNNRLSRLFKSAATPAPAVVTSTAAASIPAPASSTTTIVSSTTVVVPSTAAAIVVSSTSAATVTIVISSTAATAIVVPSTSTIAVSTNVHNATTISEDEDLFEFSNYNCGCEFTALKGELNSRWVITRSLNGATNRSPLWSAHEEQTHRSLGNPRTTGVKPGCIASSWDRTPDLPKKAKVDTHLIWKKEAMSVWPFVIETDGDDGSILVMVVVAEQEAALGKQQLVQQSIVGANHAIASTGTFTHARGHIAGPDPLWPLTWPLFWGKSPHVAAARSRTPDLCLMKDYNPTLSEAFEELVNLLHPIALEAKKHSFKYLHIASAAELALHVTGAELCSRTSNINRRFTVSANIASITPMGTAVYHHRKATVYFSYGDEEQFINALREGSDKYTRGENQRRLALLSLDLSAQVYYAYIHSVMCSCPELLVDNVSNHGSVVFRGLFMT
ncbi:hypothetical protein LXL04_038051 [Taraxacum kok-saghyz]